MMKINRYIKYLPILILLAGINVYAQTTENLNQIVSQAQQEASGLSPFFNLSSIINSPIITSLKNALGSSFLGFAIPFLFVFGVLTYITYETKKEISRPLLLIYFIIDLLVTVFFPAILILLAVIFGIILLFFGLYRLFHNITGRTIGGITGVIITTFIFFAILIRFINNSITRFLALTSFILLSVFFFILAIYALLKVKNEPSTDNIKKIIYNIHKPQDIKILENEVINRVNTFNNSVNRKRKEFENLVNILQTKYLSQQQRSKKTKGLIDLLEKIRDNIKAFYEEYRNYKRDFAHDEARINSHYNEPLKSYLLKILKEKGEREIEKIANSTYNEYYHYYLQYLRSNKQTIINMVNKNNWKTISKIFNETESLLHSFWI